MTTIPKKTPAHCTGENTRTLNPLSNVPKSPSGVTPLRVLRKQLSELALRSKETVPQVAPKGAGWVRFLLNVPQDSMHSVKELTERTVKGGPAFPVPQLTMKFAPSRVLMISPLLTEQDLDMMNRADSTAVFVFL